MIKFFEGQTLSFSGRYNGQKMYAIINTTNYNQDGCWAVIVTSHDELPKQGFENEMEEIETMQVGEQRTFEYGCDANTKNYTTKFKICPIRLICIVGL